MEKRQFFRADMAGLGKYCMGGYGRIGVYRVNYQGYIFPTVRNQVIHCDYLEVSCDNTLSPQKAR